MTSQIHNYPFMALDPTLLINKKDVALVPVSGKRHHANPIIKHGEKGEHSEEGVSFPAVRIEKGRFRMWYCAKDGRFSKYGGKSLENYQDSYEGMWLCYAESSDGINWEMPNLGLMEFNGSKDNNIIGKGACPAFLYDANDPNHRYKCVFDWFEKDIPFFPLHMGYSSDGIHWEFNFNYSQNESMECPSLFWWNGEYRSLVQIFDPLVRIPNPGAMARRANALYVSKDFKKWERVPGTAFDLPYKDPMKPAHHMQTHLGTAVFPMGRFCIGIFGRFFADSDPAKVKTSLGLCLSDDGHHFNEPFLMFDLLPLPDDPEAWDGSMLCQSSSSLIEVGNEWWVYYKGSCGGNVWHVKGKPAIGIARWRKHGFAYLTSLHEACMGTFATNEVKVPQDVCDLSANAVLSEGSEIIIRLVSGSAVYEGKVAVGDSVSQKVVWNDNIDWESIEGKKVKFRFEIKGRPNEVRLYSWEFVKKEQI